MHVYTCHHLAREKELDPKSDFTQESQNDSSAFTQFSIKWNPIFLVKFQTGERAQNSNRDRVLGKQFLQGGKVINLPKAAAFI